MESPAFTRRASLGERLSDFLGQSMEGELAKLDGLLLAAAPDPRVAHLGQASGPRLVRSEGFALHRFAHDVLSAHEGRAAEGEGGAILVGASAESTMAIPLPEEIVRAWEKLGGGALEVNALELDDEWRQTLLDAGALTYCD